MFEIPPLPVLVHDLRMYRAGNDDPHRIAGPSVVWVWHAAARTALKRMRVSKNR